MSFIVLLHLQLVWNSSSQLRLLPSPYLISALFCYCPEHTVDILHRCRTTTLTATTKKFHCLQKENFITSVKGPLIHNSILLVIYGALILLKTSDIHSSVMMPAEVRTKFRPIRQDYNWRKHCLKKGSPSQVTKSIPSQIGLLTEIPLLFLKPFTSLFQQHPLHLIGRKIDKSILLTSHNSAVRSEI